ncbi:cytochrome P450 [Cyathus striatus]|nr:cytochrome P450 [Cyathus striatus]
MDSVLFLVAASQDSRMFHAAFQYEHWLHQRIKKVLIIYTLAAESSETYQLAVELLKNPEGFASHACRLTFSRLMNVVYGIRIPSSSSDIHTKFYEFIKGWSEILVPGDQISVDAYPILKFLPEMLAPWRRLARKLSMQEKDLYFGLLERVERRAERARGMGVLRRGGLSYDSYLCRTLVEAGTNTSNAALQTFLLVMLIAFPDEMKKVQLEIDSVVGMDRMPALEDTDRLPYVRAAILEALRLRPITPLGVPHATSGAVNIHTFQHRDMDDEDLSPMQIRTFQSDSSKTQRVQRWLNISLELEGVSVLEIILQRMVCVGKVDLGAFREGITSEPKPSKCDIKPRSAKHAEMILAKYQATRRDVMHFERDFYEMDKVYIHNLSCDLLVEELQWKTETKYSHCVIGPKLQT